MREYNDEIIAMISERLEFGKNKYGHGVQVQDGSIDWENMMMEEALDGMVYAAAQLIRLKAQRPNVNSNSVGASETIEVGKYIITKKDAKYTCTCPDFRHRIVVPVIKHEGCKHIVNYT